jgi:hypothetical protein
MQKKPMIYAYLEGNDTIIYCYKGLYYQGEYEIKGALGNGLMSFFWPEKDFLKVFI